MSIGLSIMKYVDFLELAREDVTVDHDESDDDLAAIQEEVDTIKESNDNENMGEDISDISFDDEHARDIDPLIDDEHACDSLSGHVVEVDDDGGEVR